MEKQTKRKDYLEAISLVIFLIVTLALAVATFRALDQHFVQHTEESAKLKSYCDSVGGVIGNDKCYVDGKEIKEVENE